MSLAGMLAADYRLYQTVMNIISQQLLFKSTTHIEKHIHCIALHTPNHLYSTTVSLTATAHSLYQHRHAITDYTSEHTRNHERRSNHSESCHRCRCASISRHSSNPSWMSLHMATNKTGTKGCQRSIIR